jgi:hypothetical protein
MRTFHDPETVTIEIACRVPRCSCFRMVEARLVAGEHYAAPEGEEHCRDCLHANPAHRVLGVTLSRFERGRRLSGF